MKNVYGFMDFYKAMNLTTYMFKHLRSNFLKFLRLNITKLRVKTFKAERIGYFNFLKSNDFMA